MFLVRKGPLGKIGKKRREVCISQLRHREFTTTLGTVRESDPYACVTYQMAMNASEERTIGSDLGDEWISLVS